MALCVICTDPHGERDKLFLNKWYT